MGPELPLQGPATLTNYHEGKGHLYLTMILSELQVKAIWMVASYVGSFAGLVGLVNLLGWMIERVCRK